MVPQRNAIRSDFRWRKMRTGLQGLLCPPINFNRYTQQFKKQQRIGRCYADGSQAVLVEEIRANFDLAPTLCLSAQLHISSRIKPA